MAFHIRFVGSFLPMQIFCMGMGQLFWSINRYRILLPLDIYLLKRCQNHEGKHKLILGHADLKTHDNDPLRLRFPLGV